MQDREEKTLKDWLLENASIGDFEQEVRLIRIATYSRHTAIFAVKRDDRWLVSSDKMGTCYMFEDGEFGYRGGLHDENPNSYPTFEEAIAAFHAIYKPKINDNIIRVGDRIICMNDWTGTVTKIENRDGKEWREVIEAFDKSITLE